MHKASNNKKQLEVQITIQYNKNYYFLLQYYYYKTNY